MYIEIYTGAIQYILQLYSVTLYIYIYGGSLGNYIDIFYPAIVTKTIYG